MCERTRSLVRAGAVDDQRHVVDKTDDPGGGHVERPWMVRGRLATPRGGTSRYPRPRLRSPTDSRPLVHASTPLQPGWNNGRIPSCACLGAALEPTRRPVIRGWNPGLKAHPVGLGRKAGTPRRHKAPRRRGGPPALTPDVACTSTAGIPLASRGTRAAAGRVDRRQSAQVSRRRSARGPRRSPGAGHR